MNKLFDDDRNYQPDDPEVIEVMGDKDTQAQKRHHKTSPSNYRLGRKIIYRGIDLNAWAEIQRIETFSA